MKGAKFDPKKLQMLSPDADDWNKLLASFDWLNQEGCIYGVLLYPKERMGKVRVEDEITTWLTDNHKAINHGSLECIIKQRGNHWAYLYHITGWYNHFDLNECYD